MTLDNFTSIAQTRVEGLFRLYLETNKQPAVELNKAISYAVFNGGKRIRPLLVYLTGRALGAPWENLDAPACAIEFIHAYSLIHDDLPAMDNADLRRGKPSCHKAFSEALAILAGDALQPLAFEVLASHPSQLSPQQRLNMIQELSHESGAHGMAAGQTLDLLGVSSIESLTNMYHLKTGALLTTCVTLGMIAADKSSLDIKMNLKTFAQSLGLAFQIQDDLLDIEGTTESIGKPQGLDINKITYPKLIGIEASREKIQSLFNSALQAIDFLGSEALLLKEFAYQLLKRKK